MKTTEKFNIVVYSQGGTTAKLAEEVSSLLGLKMTRVEEKSKRNNFFTLYFMGGFQSMADARPPLLTDLSSMKGNVIIFSPVWAGVNAAPVNTVISSLPLDGSSVLFVLTMGGDSSPKAFSSLEKKVSSSGGSLAGVLEIKTHKTDPGENVKKITKWLREELAIE